MYSKINTPKISTHPILLIILFLISLPINPLPLCSCISNMYSSLLSLHSTALRHTLVAQANYYGRIFIASEPVSNTLSIYTNHSLFDIACFL